MKARREDTEDIVQQEKICINPYYYMQSSLSEGKLLEQVKVRSEFFTDAKLSHSVVSSNWLTVSVPQLAQGLASFINARLHLLMQHCCSLFSGYTVA